MKFNKLFQLINEHILNEGGNAVKNVVKIEQKYIPETIKNFKKKIINKLNLNKDEWSLLGSALKKKTPSGDLDIGIDIFALSRFFNLTEEIEILQKFYEWLKDTLNLKEIDDIIFLKGINVISIAFPIANTKDRIQIDFMPTNDLEFSKFAYHSPDEIENVYFGKPGLYRNFLIMSIVKNIDYQVLKKDEKTNIPELIKYIQYSITDGIREVVYSYRTKTGKLSKNKTKISEIFKTKNVKEIIEFILGKGATEKDIDSFENIMKRMESPNFPYKDKIPEIKNTFLEKLEDFNKRLINNNQAPLPKPF